MKHAMADNHTIRNSKRRKITIAFALVGAVTILAPFVLGVFDIELADLPVILLLALGFFSLVGSCVLAALLLSDAKQKILSPGHVDDAALQSKKNTWIAYSAIALTLASIGTIFFIVMFL